MASTAAASSSARKVATTYNFTLAQVRVTNLTAGSGVALRWRAARLRHHGRTDAVTVGLNGIACFAVGAVAFPVALKPAAGVADEWAPRTVRFSLLEMPRSADHHNDEEEDENEEDNDESGVLEDDDDDDEDIVPQEDNDRKKQQKKEQKQKKKPGFLARWRERRAAHEVARCTLQLAYFADADAKPVVVEMERTESRRHRRDGAVSPLMVSVNPLLAVTVTAHPKGAAASEGDNAAAQREE